MGWSCNQLAALRMDAISRACIANCGNQNTWEHKGNKYFYETSRRDGDGVTGSIYKFLPDGNCRKSSSFKVSGDGMIERGPKFFKDAPAFLLVITDQKGTWHELWGDKPADNATLASEIPFHEALFSKANPHLDPQIIQHAQIRQFGDVSDDSLVVAEFFASLSS